MGSQDIMKRSSRPGHKLVALLKKARASDLNLSLGDANTGSSLAKYIQRQTNSNSDLRLPKPPSITPEALKINKELGIIPGMSLNTPCVSSQNSLLGSAELRVTTEN